MTLHISTRKPTIEECNTLAAITISDRKNTPLESGKTLEKISQDIVGISHNDNYEIVMAMDEERIVGWIYYYTGFMPMAFISGFSPIIDPENDSENIALQLIEVSKENIVARGFTRLEIEFAFLSDAHQKLSRKYIDWYEKCGFQFAAEEVHMKADLSTIAVPELAIPEGYAIRRFSEVHYDRLEVSGFRTFENGQDQLFLSMSHAEQQVNIQHFFNKTSPFVEDASLVLEHEGDIIGFIITRGREGEIEIGPVGLVPDFKGKGLGSFLLGQALSTLQNNKEKTVVLDMSVGNIPARKLYTKYGFKDDYHKQFYYWSP